MPLSRTGIAYLGLILLSGAAIAAYASGRPPAAYPLLPAFAWPLPVSLVFDLAVMQLARAGRATLLTMGERVAGVFGAGLIVVAATASRAS